MTLLLNGATILLSLTGAFFCLAGTVGLLRFPDTFTRLHAITKADNLGLGFIVLALLIQSTSVLAGAKLILIWLLALLAGANVCFMIGRWALQRAEEAREEHER